MSVQIQVEVKCTPEIALDCAQKAVKKFKVGDIHVNKATQTLFFTAMDRMTGDGFVARKVYIVSVMEKDPSTSIMCITGVSGNSTTTGSAPALEFTAVFLFAFEQCFADYASPSTPS